MIEQQLVSVVIPTRNESENVSELFGQLSAALHGREWEAVFVDDSDDETPDVLAAIGRTDPRARTIHRPKGARSGGLGGAVTEGFRNSRGDVVVVMDADLQHPPATVAHLVDALQNDSSDLALATRYRDGGSAGGLNGAFRHAASRGCRLFAHTMLPRTRGLSDPLGGFFAFRRRIIENVDLRPEGYKILMEVLVRSNWSTFSEVPYHFQMRNAGDSKSNVTEAKRFIRHVMTLRGNGATARRRRMALASAQATQDVLAAVGTPSRSGGLRALIVTSEAPPVISGISKTVAMLQSSLTEQGHQVDVVSRADFPRFMRDEIRLSAFAFFWPSLRKRIHTYDVVNLHGPVPTISDAFLLLASTLHRHDRPAIVYTHHSDLAITWLPRACALYNRVAKRLAHRADGIVVSSNSYHDKMQAKNGKSIDVIPWAVEVAGRHVTRAARGTGPLKVLFVGQLRPYKGVNVLLDAVAGQNDIEVTLIGGGPMKDEIERRISSEKLSNVTMLGRLSDEELWQAYSSHDVITLPSTTTAEAYGLVLAEGMSAGCVPVASDLPGVRDLAGPTGLVVRPGSASSLRSALKRLAEDTDLLAKLSLRSLEQSTTLSVTSMAERYETVFRSALTVMSEKRALFAVPDGWNHPNDLLTDITSELGIQRASLSLTPRDENRMAYTWHAERGSVRAEAPIARYVAAVNHPVLITPNSPGDDVVRTMLRRPELTSAILLPIHWSRRNISVVSLSTDQSNDTLLDETHVDKALEFFGRARHRVPA